MFKVNLDLIFLTMQTTTLNVEKVTFLELNVLTSELQAKSELVRTNFFVAILFFLNIGGNLIFNFFF